MSTWLGAIADPARPLHRGRESPDCIKAGDFQVRTCAAGKPDHLFHRRVDPIEPIQPLPRLELAFMFRYAEILSMKEKYFARGQVAIQIIDFRNDSDAALNRDWIARDCRRLHRVLLLLFVFCHCWNSNQTGTHFPPRRALHQNERLEDTLRPQRETSFARQLQIFKSGIDFNLLLSIAF